jgi:hypothetical protein
MDPDVYVPFWGFFTRANLRINQFQWQLSRQKNILILPRGFKDPLPFGIDLPMRIRSR